MSFTVTASSRYGRASGATTTASAVALPTVKLLVTATGSAPVIPLNALLTVTRIHADGTRHQVLAEQGSRLAGGTWTWLDVHCPYNQQVTYEAVANGQTATATPIWILSSNAYLIHSSNADLAMRIDVITSLGEQRAASRSAKFDPVGASSVFLSDGRREGLEGSIEFRCDRTDLARWRTGLFTDDQVVLLNTPGTTGWDLGWMWLQPNDVTYSNPGEIISYRYRHVTMDYHEAADPVVDLEPAWSSADALRYWTTNAGLTSADMISRYATSLDFLTDTRL